MTKFNFFLSKIDNFNKNYKENFSYYDYGDYGEFVDYDEEKLKEYNIAIEIMVCSLIIDITKAQKDNKLEIDTQTFDKIYNFLNSIKYTGDNEIVNKYLSNDLLVFYWAGDDLLSREIYDGFDNIYDGIVYFDLDKKTYEIDITDPSYKERIAEESRGDDIYDFQQGAKLEKEFEND